MNEKIKGILVLTTTSLVCGILLYFVYSLTGGLN